MDVKDCVHVLGWGRGGWVGVVNSNCPSKFLSSRLDCCAFFTPSFVTFLFCDSSYLQVLLYGN